MTRDERGQAAVETLMLTMVLVTFIAAAYQIFLVNQTIYRSLTSVHQTLFSRGFERNCSEDRADGSCEYSQDPGSDGFGGQAARVVWTPEEVPEIAIPVVGLFRAYGLDDGFRLGSNRLDFAGGDYMCPGVPCKRTRMGAGTYKGLFEGVWLLGRTRLTGVDIGQVLDALGTIGDLLGGEE